MNRVIEYSKLCQYLNVFWVTLKLLFKVLNSNNYLYYKIVEFKISLNTSKFRKRKLNCICLLLDFFSEPNFLSYLHLSIVPFPAIWMCLKCFISSKPGQKSLKMLLTWLKIHKILFWSSRKKHFLVQSLKKIVLKKNSTVKNQVFLETV